MPITQIGDGVLPADEMILALLTPFMSDLAAEHVRTAVSKAGGIRMLTDATARAELDLAKRKFGNRSAAGTYAANVRWRGSRTEYVAPGPRGEKARTTTLGTKLAQFEVVPIRASQVKVGDIVSSGGDRRPMKVLEIIPGRSRTEMRMRDIDERSGPRQSTTWVRPNADMRLWTVLEVEKAERRSFGSRSEAGRYAAQVRWGKRSQTGSSPTTPSADGASSGADAFPHAGAFDRGTMLEDEERAIHGAYDKAGFGAEKDDALATVAKTRKTLYDAEQLLRAGTPVETVRANLLKEVKRLRSLSTKTRNKADELDRASGGPKKDAEGAIIPSRAIRIRTDAVVMSKMARMLETTANRLVPP